MIMPVRRKFRLKKYLHVLLNIRTVCYSGRGIQSHWGSTNIPKYLQPSIILLIYT